MDKQFLFANLPSTDSKLTRASSYSELSASKKFTVEQLYQSQTGGNLTKQYSCEEIFDHSLNTRHFTMSQVFKSDDKKQANMWKMETDPKHSPAKTFDESRMKEKSFILQENLSFPNEYFIATSAVGTRQIIAPPKLIVNDSELKRSELNSQNNDKNSLNSSNNESYNQSLIKYNKPSTISRMSSLLNYYCTDGEKTQANTINRSQSFDLTKLSIKDMSPKKAASNSEINNEVSFNALSSESNFLFKLPSIPNKKSIVKNCHSNIKHEIEKIDTNQNNYINLEEKNNFTNEDEKKIDTSELKKRLRSLVPTESQNFSKRYSGWAITFMILLPIAIIYLAIFLNDINFINEFCVPQFKINKVTEDVQKLIHGQNNAVKKISHFFNAKENRNGFDIIVLVGGIGVGKSYTTEIIRNNLKETSNFIDFSSPLYRKEDQAYSSLSICKCNVIRLENLKNDDIVDAARFAAFLKKRAKNYCILIIAIFNTEETGYNLQKVIDIDKSLSSIKDNFERVNLQPIMVTYVPLDDEALTNCIKDLANYVNVELSNEDIENIKHDLIAAESGCKGAYAKIQIIGNMRKQSSHV